jgi:predicted nuclease of restriction endonuclease-like RecB superfamily
MKKFMANVEVFRTFDREFLFKFLEKLRESGIVNMYAAAPYLYMGGGRIYGENHYNENKDEEAFDELVEMADEAKDKMIQGAVKILEKEGKEISVEKVSRVIKKYAGMVLDMWMTTYR